MPPSWEPVRLHPHSHFHGRTWPLGVVHAKHIPITFIEVTIPRSKYFAFGTIKCLRCQVSSAMDVCALWKPTRFYQFPPQPVPGHSHAQFIQSLTASLRPLKPPKTEIQKWLFDTKEK